MIWAQNEYSSDIEKFRIIRIWSIYDIRTYLNEYNKRLELEYGFSWCYMVNNSYSNNWDCYVCDL